MDLVEHQRVRRQTFLQRVRGCPGFLVGFTAKFKEALPNLPTQPNPWVLYRLVKEINKVRWEEDQEAQKQKWKHIASVHGLQEVTDDAASVFKSGYEDTLEALKYAEKTQAINASRRKTKGTTSARSNDEQSTAARYSNVGTPTSPVVGKRKQREDDGEGNPETPAQKRVRGDANVMGPPSSASAQRAAQMMPPPPPRSSGIKPLGVQELQPGRRREPCLLRLRPEDCTHNERTLG